MRRHLLDCGYPLLSLLTCRAVLLEAEHGRRGLQPMACRLTGQHLRHQEEAEDRHALRLPGRRGDTEGDTHSKRARRNDHGAGRHCSVLLRAKCPQQRERADSRGARGRGGRAAPRPVAGLPGGPPGPETLPRRHHEPQEGPVHGQGRTAAGLPGAQGGLAWRARTAAGRWRGAGCTRRSRGAGDARPDPEDVTVHRPQVGRQGHCQQRAMSHRAAGQLSNSCLVLLSVTPLGA
mmetsp:Transcript_105555/g.293915  ORF Transcript_105555/g.293915 Transcript_105555/m.293915 type:complete len:234 (-) Transcript_105555:48-749(-)